MAYFLATVQRHGTMACRPGEHEPRWFGVFPMAAWVHLLGAVDLAALRGQVVVLEGDAIDVVPPCAPLPPGWSPKNCPVPQLRSDMVESVDGILHRRGHEPAMSAFLVRAARPFGGLTASGEGTVTLRFTNTLPVALEDVVLTAHFEGRFGKPGSERREATAGPLAPGEAVELAVPRELVGSVPHPRGPRSYGLVVVLVRGRGADVRVAVDVPLRSITGAQAGGASGVLR